MIFLPLTKSVVANSDSNVIVGHFVALSLG